MSQDIFKVKLLKKQQIAKTTSEFIFEKPFTFLPGQFITLFLGNDSRDFTIASSPLDKTFSIVTKEGVSNFKKELFLQQPGSRISIKKPAGGFTIPEKNQNQYVFLAGGIGVTPFYSMILYASQKHLLIPITLLVSFSKKEDSIFYNQLHEIAVREPHLKIVYSFSQDHWEGEEGRISENLIRKYTPEIYKSNFLIAGGEEMTYDTEKLLLKMGIDNSKIRIDTFTGY